jgi:hypothetical protein
MGKAFVDAVNVALAGQGVCEESSRASDVERASSEVERALDATHSTPRDRDHS